MEVTLSVPFDMRNLSNGSVGKPRELIVRHVMLVPVYVQSEAPRVDMGDLSLRGVRAKRS